MFEGLSDRLGGLLKEVRGHGTISEKNITDALREVRIALLEADVNIGVVKDFISSVKEKALGEEVIGSLTPGQQLTKIIHDELKRVLGGSDAPLSFKRSPAVIMMTGLQGSGKTTSSAKLAVHLKKKGRRPFLVPCDLARPAAVLQLEKLGADNKVDVFKVEELTDTKVICQNALRTASLKGYDTVIVDTAGRLHIDEALMGELKSLKEILDPSEILFVADSMTGQDAVNTATGFNETLGITGSILTKLDGDARGGAALSMRLATGVPIKFAGTGEKIDAFDIFHPERLAGRILGMGDVLTLVEKTQEAVDEKKAKELERKFKSNAFTLQDFKDQLQQVKKMGSISSLLSMVPGFSAMQKQKNIDVDERDLVVVEAIIDSMTPKEKRKPDIINGSRKKRIASGSGTRVQDVNRLLKQYKDMKKMMKRLKKSGPGALKGMFQQ